MPDHMTAEARAEKAKKQGDEAINLMNLATQRIHQGIQAMFKTAFDQILTVQIPGTQINPADYVYDSNSLTFVPLSVRVAEARLVDGMLPVAKATLGKTGRSVQRSYSTALDLLVPVEASLAGTIADDETNNQSKAGEKVSGQHKVIKERYQTAMRYLVSYANPKAKTGRDGKEPETKLQRYIVKQTAWSTAVQDYAKARDEAENRAIEKHVDKSIKDPQESKNMRDEARNDYLMWVQANGRDFKQAIQARYMDWVVHGFKFNIEYYFGLVDLSSGVARIENSKEAIRGLILIGEDGFTEYPQVHLEPTNWASHIQYAYDHWDELYGRPSPTEIRGEIKRLQNILLSHEALLASVKDDSFKAPAPADNSELNAKLRTAYTDAYKSRSEAWGLFGTGGWSGLTTKSAEEAKKIGKAGDEWQAGASESNRQVIDKAHMANAAQISGYMERKIQSIQQEIDDLRAMLPNNVKAPPPAGGDQGTPPTAPTNTEIPETAIPQAIGPDGLEIPAEDTKKGVDFMPTKTRPNPFTTVQASVSLSSSTTDKSSDSSSSSSGGSGGWGFFHAGGSYSEASSHAHSASSISNLSIEIKTDCMLVEIDRPWLHGELFLDPDLDIGEGFEISPGPESIMPALEKDPRQGCKDPRHMLFPSYPTAFLVACNTSMSFSGDTSDLEENLSSSSSSASGSVGFGPWSVSHSRTKSQSKSNTRMESTNSGMRIEIQAPQIIAWVQTILPKIPKDKDSN